MSEKQKDYTSTLLRMAGNIAAGFAGRGSPEYCNEERACEIAEKSLLIAAEILKQALASSVDPPQEGPQ